MKSTSILIVGTIAVLGVFAAVKFAGLPVTPDELEAAFTGLGFVGVVAAFLHEREQAAGAEKEHWQLLTALKAQSAEMAKSSRIQATAAQLQMWNDRWAQCRSDMVQIGGQRGVNIGMPDTLAQRSWDEVMKLQERLDTLNGDHPPGYVSPQTGLPPVPIA